jgi:hypothetical protein
MILLLGERVRPLESIERVGSVLELSRSTAFRRSRLWPLDGDPGSRRVVVTKLAEQLGIPYQIVREDGGER